jgi:polysaccharide deacetylase family protein (PEP-CTERM system associated)
MIQPQLNALTIDVEDWAQACLDPTFPLTGRFIRNTHRVLEVLAAHDVKATFFVLGLAARKAPSLVSEIQTAGHEIQSHGYGHRLLHTLTPEQFRRDLEDARKVLEDVVGLPVNGYRAPAFSITTKTLWALDVLAQCGFRYDSSVFPVRTHRYGIRGAARVPHRLRTPGGSEIIEVPVASYRWAGRTWPLGGGGYFRLAPYALIRRAVRKLNVAAVPATVYLHPHEFDPDEFKEMVYPVSWPRRIHQSCGRRGIPSKIHRLLTDFRFGPVRDVLREYQRF